MTLVLKFRQIRTDTGHPGLPNQLCPSAQFAFQLSAMKLPRWMTKLPRWLRSKIPATPLLKGFIVVLIGFVLALALTWAVVMGVLFPLALDFTDSASLASAVFTCVATLAVAVGFFLTAYVEEGRRLIEGTGAMLSILNTFTTSDMYNSHSTPFEEGTRFMADPTHPITTATKRFRNAARMLDSEKAVSITFTPVTLQYEDEVWLQLRQYQIQRPIKEYGKGTGKLVISTWEVGLALNKHWEHCARWKPGFPDKRYTATAVCMYYHPVIDLLLSYSLWLVPNVYLSTSF